MVDEVAFPHHTTGAAGVVQQYPPLQWPTTLPSNASTPMKYLVPGDNPVNVVLVEEVEGFSVCRLPATASWIFAEYLVDLVAPVTAFHENVIEFVVADAHINPVGAGSGDEVPHAYPGGHPALGNSKPSGGKPASPATDEPPPPS